VIADVAENSPADHAGLRKGDVVIMADDRQIRTAAQLRNKVGLARIGQDVRLRVQRNGVPLTIDVKVEPPLAQSNASTGKTRVIR